MNQGWEKIAMKKKIHYKIVFVKYTIILIIKKNIIETCLLLFQKKICHFSLDLVQNYHHNIFLKKFFCSLFKVLGVHTLM